MTRAFALLPLLTLTACAIEPGPRAAPSDAGVLGGFFSWLTVPCACAAGLCLALWANPEEFGDISDRALPPVVGSALMWVVLLVLAGPA